MAKTMEELVKENEQLLKLKGEQGRKIGELEAKVKESAPVITNKAVTSDVVEDLVAEFMENPRGFIYRIMSDMRPEQYEHNPLAKLSGNVNYILTDRQLEGKTSILDNMDFQKRVKEKQEEALRLGDKISIITAAKQVKQEIDNEATKEKAEKDGMAEDKGHAETTGKGSGSASIKTPGEKEQTVEEDIANSIMEVAPSTVGGVTVAQAPL